jgi:hypothetical protein
MASAKNPTKAGKATASAGNNTHSAAAAATTSTADTSSCCVAMDALGSRTTRPGNSFCSPPREQMPRNTPAATSTETPANFSRAEDTPSISCPVAEPHTSAAAPTTAMPTVKPTALKTMAREISPASSPAAPYRRRRTAPPVSTPRPMVLDSA